jgi:hypothetical protein
MLFVLALFSAAVMGFAITRGATCMVSAADEIVHKRSAKKLIALVEASIWVAAGLSVAVLAGLMPRPVGDYPIAPALLFGAVLLGAGAYVNRACVFGSIARLGSGEWHYLLTPVGFLLGCIAVQPLLHTPDGKTMSMSGLPVFPLVILGGLVLFMLLRGAGLALAAKDRRLAAHIWSPHLATTVIGIAFVVLILSAGAWTYPEALAELSRGVTMNSLGRIALFGALLAGAMLGGWGKERLGKSWSWRAGLGCLAGGALMGMGSLLIPGSNDSLVLVGLPFLLPYAWAAILTMLLSIFIAMMAEEGMKWALARSGPRG